VYSFNDIKRVHLELSSLCNARCPGCPRNFYGYPYNDGYIERNLSLSEIQQIFTDDFLQQIEKIRINGNFGDFVSNNESPAIIKWFLKKNRKLKIRVTTNASAQGKQFWQNLGKLGITIDFCLDGSKQTHSIYRQGTNFDKIISNAKIFMDNGGIAYWRLIEFQHNKDEIKTLRITSDKLGFRKFLVIKNTRGQLPAYDIKGRLVSSIDNYNKEELLNDKLSKRKTDEVLLEDIMDGRVPCDIKCEVSQSKELYISSTGDVYPCCYMGFEPKTYGHGNYFEPVNTQIKSLIGRNNAITYEIDECISWFNNIKNTWDIKTFENGRLVACNDNCGECNN